MFENRKFNIVDSRHFGNLIVYGIVLSMDLFAYVFNILRSFEAKHVGDNLKRLIRSSRGIFIKELRYQ